MDLVVAGVKCGENGSGDGSGGDVGKGSIDSNQVELLW